jgi:hypothetical protein
VGSDHSYRSLKGGDVIGLSETIATRKTKMATSEIGGFHLAFKNLRYFRLKNCGLLSFRSSLRSRSRLQKGDVCYGLSELST